MYTEYNSSGYLARLLSYSGFRGSPELLLRSCPGPRRLLIQQGRDVAWHLPASRSEILPALCTAGHVEAPQNCMCHAEGCSVCAASGNPSQPFTLDLNGNTNVTGGSTATAPAIDSEVNRIVNPGVTYNAGGRRL